MTGLSPAEHSCGTGGANRTLIYGFGDRRSAIELHLFTIVCVFKMEPRVGLEPTTYALQVRCTASCATAAYKGSNLRHSDY